MSKFIRWKIHKILGAYHQAGPQVLAEGVWRMEDLEDSEKVETQVQKLFQRPHQPSQKAFYCLEWKDPVTLSFV